MFSFNNIRFQIFQWLQRIEDGKLWIKSEYVKSDATWLFNWNFLSRIMNLKISVLFLFCAFADESFGVNLEPSAKLWQLLLPTCVKAQSWAWGIYYLMRLVGNWPYLNQRFSRWQTRGFQSSKQRTWHFVRNYDTQNYERLAWTQWSCNVFKERRETEVL